MTPVSKQGSSIRDHQQHGSIQTIQTQQQQGIVVTLLGARNQCIDRGPCTGQADGQKCRYRGPRRDIQFRQPEDRLLPFQIVSTLPRDPENPPVASAPPTQRHAASVEEAQHLATNLLPPSLLVVNDARAGGDDDVAKLAGGQQACDPGLDVMEGHVVAGGDDAALVEAAVQLNHNLASAVVVHLEGAENAAVRQAQRAASSLQSVTREKLAQGNFVSTVCHP